MDFNKLATQTEIEQTILALNSNGIDAEITDNGLQAKEKLLSLLPKGVEVMTMTSVTLDTIGATKEINDSGSFDSVRIKLSKLDREKDSSLMQKLGSAPEYAVGSVHAVTQDGKIIVASNTGSQLPAYVYGASHVIWVVGTQKIVKDLDQGLKRVYDYVLPKEADRARAAYGAAGSNVSKLMIINKEINPQRIHLIFVKEQLGF